MACRELQINFAQRLAPVASPNISAHAIISRLVGDLLLCCWFHRLHSDLDRSLSRRAVERPSIVLLLLLSDLLWTRRVRAPIQMADRSHRFWLARDRVRGVWIDQVTPIRP